MERRAAASMAVTCVLLAAPSFALSSERAAAAELAELIEFRLAVVGAGPNLLEGPSPDAQAALRLFPDETVTGYVSFRAPPYFGRMTSVRLAASLDVRVVAGDGPSDGNPGEEPEAIPGIEWSVSPEFPRGAGADAFAKLVMSRGSLPPGEYSLIARLKDAALEAALGPHGARRLRASPVRIIAGPPTSRSETMWAGLTRAGRAFEAGDCALSERLAGEVLAIEPRFILALSLIASARAAVGDTAGALLALETARELVQGDAPTGVPFVETREQRDQYLDSVDREIKGLTRPVAALRAFDAEGRLIASTTIDEWVTFRSGFMESVSCVDSQGYLPELVGTGVHSVVLERARRMRVRVRSSAGGPLPDAKARLVSAPAECPREAAASADGVVTIEISRSGDLVDIVAPGHVPERVTLGTTSHDIATVTLAARTNIAVHVRDAAGEPIVNSTVRCTPPEFAGSASRAVMRTNRFGMAWFSGPRGATCTVAVSSPGHAPAWQVVRATEADQAVTFTLGVGGSVTARVLEWADRPAQLVAWRLLGVTGDGPDGIDEVITTHGVARIDGLPAGRCEFDIRALGRAPLHRVIDIAEGVTVDLGDLVTTDEGALTGVLKHGRQVLDGVRVTLSAPSGPERVFLASSGVDRDRVGGRPARSTRERAPGCAFRPGRER